MSLNKGSMALFVIARKKLPQKDIISGKFLFQTKKI